MPTGTAPTSAPARPPSPATSRSPASLPPCPQPRSNARRKRTSQSSARACPQLRDRSTVWAVEGLSAEEEDRPMRRYALSDDQWDRIRDLLPGREGYVGVTAKDNRLFVEAVLYRYRAGIPWRDLPERFGAWKKVHTQGKRMRSAGSRRPSSEGSAS